MLSETLGVPTNKCLLKKGRAKFGGEIYKEMGQKSDLNGTEKA